MSSAKAQKSPTATWTPSGPDILFEQVGCVDSLHRAGHHWAFVSVECQFTNIQWAPLLSDMSRSLKTSSQSGFLFLYAAIAHISLVIQFNTKIEAALMKLSPFCSENLHYMTVCTERAMFHHNAQQYSWWSVLVLKHANVDAEHTVMVAMYKTVKQGWT